MKNHLATILLMPSMLFAQTDWSSVSIQTQKVTDNISFLIGRGGNIGVIYGKEGVMIIDDQYAPLSEKIKVAISSLSAGELKFIINTHYHGDHTGGNENLSKDGAIIVAHENVKERLSTTFYSTMFDREVEAKSEAYWPKLTFKDNLSFDFNGEEIDVIYTPAAHTDGDAIIHFKSSNAIHAGDAFVRYGYPFIDTSAGGSIQGFIDAQDLILSLANAETKIIPGHGGLSTIEDVKELKAMLVETKELVAKLKEEGKSLDDVLTANPLQPYHERWSGSFIDTQLFTRAIYQSLE